MAKKKFIRMTNIEQGFIDAILNNSLDVVTRQTGSTFGLNTDKYKILVSQNNLDNKELNIIRTIQKDANEFLKETTLQNTYYSSISFKQFDKRFLNYMGKEVVAIDLRSAYPTTLKNIGAIKEETYKRLMNVPKEKRMWCIGTLASSPNIKTYREGKLITDEIKHKDTLQVWQHTLKKVDDLMKLLLKKYSIYPVKELFCFAYYVDCLFFVAPKSYTLFEDMFLPEFKEDVSSYEYSVTYGLYNKSEATKKMVQFLFNEKEKTYFFSDNRNVKYSKSVI